MSLVAGEVGISIAELAGVEIAEPQRSPSASSRRAGLPEFADFLPNAGDRFTRGFGHQPTVVGDRGQAEAHPDHARRIGRLAAMDAGIDPALSARRQHSLVHAELLGIFAVEFGRLAEREGKIGKADMDRIDPGNIQDLVDVLDCLAGFDHRDLEPGLCAAR